MAIKHYGRLYQADLSHGRLTCAYCGDVRECLDHCPPISLIERIGVKALKERHVDFILYPCCNKCNKILGSRLLANYEERLSYLYEYTQNSLDGKIFWTKEELSELGGELRRMVEARQKVLRHEYVIRLRGMEENLNRLTRKPEY